MLLGIGKYVIEKPMSIGPGFFWAVHQYKNIGILDLLSSEMILSSRYFSRSIFIDEGEVCANDTATSMKLFESDCQLR